MSLLLRLRTSGPTYNPEIAGAVGRNRCGAFSVEVAPQAIVVGAISRSKASAWGMTIAAQYAAETSRSVRGAALPAAGSEVAGARWRGPLGASESALTTFSATVAGARWRGPVGAAETSLLTFIAEVAGVVTRARGAACLSGIPAPVPPPTKVSSVAVPLVSVISTPVALCGVKTEPMANIVRTTPVQLVNVTVEEIMNAIPLYSTLRIPGEFTNYLGALVDPTAVVLRVINPAGTVTTYSGGQITKDAVGKYSKTVYFDTPGEWLYRWYGTGSNPGTSDDIVVPVNNSAFAAAP